MLFRLRTCSSGLLEDKKICRVFRDEMCVLCDSGVVEDVAHFLVGYGEFERYRQVLLVDLCRIVGARERLDEYQRVKKEGNVALLLGRGLEGIYNKSDGGGGRICRLDRC